MSTIHALTQKHIVHVWSIDPDILSTDQTVFDLIKECEPESIATLARQMDMDELDAIDEFGPGSYWMFEHNFVFRVTHLEDQILVELLK